MKANPTNARAAHQEALTATLDTDIDRATIPTRSWWTGLGREELSAAVKAEAPRMRHSRAGRLQFGPLIATRSEWKG